MPTKPTYYIHDTGDGIVNSSLMEMTNDNSGEIEIRLEMECFDSKGHLVKLTLHKIPVDLMEKLRQKRAKGDFRFREFVSRKSDGSLPNEVLWGDAKRKYSASPAMKSATNRLKELKCKRQMGRKFTGVH